MKRMITLVFVLAAVFCLALTMTACTGTRNKANNNANNANNTKNDNPNNNNGQMTEPATVNPIVDYKSLGEAETAIGYSFMQPGMMPDGYAANRYMVIDNKTIEVNYDYDGSAISYRAMRNAANDDISGNYNTYGQTNTLNYNNVDYNTMGDNDLISVANWRTGDMSYSLMFDNPVDSDTFQSIVSSIGMPNKT